MALDLLHTIGDRTRQLTSVGATYWDAPASMTEVRNNLEDLNEKIVLDGLKKLVVLMSVGGKVVEVFPSVVKLLASPNPEVKKVVHRYLIQYAEFEPDLALMGINLLKKDLSSPNQLARAQALRTLSSLRVKMILPVVTAAVTTAAKDSSPFVRKVCATAATKLYQLDSSLLEPMVEVIDKLLGDRSTSVIGAAATAFNEVCPEHFDLIHPHFRRLCENITDVDEWGQVPLLQLLTRYGRSQFVNPDLPQERKRKSDGLSDESESTVQEEEGEDKDDYFDSDRDHRLLLDCVTPLLLSLNPSVVLATVSMFRYLAPRAERPKIGKALVRLLRSGREIANLVLEVIVSLAHSDPAIFTPHLTEFFIKTSDPTFVRKQKLLILTLLATESNVERLLREFKYYTALPDKEFVEATIRAMGDVALRIPAVVEQSLTQLLSLLSSQREHVVAESVIIIKQLLQMPSPLPTEEGVDNDVQMDDAIMQLTKLFDEVNEPSARASIVWVVGEYVGKVKEYAPDILRRLAKNFPEESTQVKVQVLNLASKLILTNPEETTLLAKYDSDFDVRDKARLLRAFVLKNEDGPTKLSKFATRLLLAKKPTPPCHSGEETSSQPQANGSAASPTGEVRDGLGTLLTLDSLSFVVKQRVPHYISLPEWAIEPTDPINRRPPTTQGLVDQHPYVNEQSWEQNGEGFYDDANFYGDENGEYYEEEYYEEEYAEEGDYYEEGEGEYYEEEYYEEQSFSILRYQ